MKDKGITEAIELRCAIIDDEPLACELIKSYVESTEGLSCEAVFDSSVKAIPAVMADKFDLVFLDINMPGLNGIELGGMLSKSTRVIYITAYSHYAVDGFKVNALDYLLKPVSYPEFVRAVSKAFEWKRQQVALSLAENVVYRAPSLQSIMVKSDYRLVQILIENILYIEAKGDKVIFNRDNEPQLSTQMSLKELEDILPAELFMKVHRSFIVNLNKVKLVERSRIIFGKTYIPVSDNHRDEFMRRLNVASR